VRLLETLSMTHGCSLSNLPLFVAAGSGLFEEEGLHVVAPPFTAMSSTAEALATGAAELGTAAFTQPMIDCTRSNPPVLVAGSGLMGVSVLAQPGICDVGELRGRPVGTFRGDPLEVLLHDVLISFGMAMADLDVRYLDDIAEAMAEFTAGELAAITLAEPHANRLRADGAVDLSDGRELWGDPFPDTVLVASARVLAERPTVVSAAIRALLRAERVIAADPAAAIGCAAPHFPGYSVAELAEAAVRQPPLVDIRALAPTVLGRWGSLQSLGLAPSEMPTPEASISLDLLTAELQRFDGALTPDPFSEGLLT
jgi:NitT/TauT family transport system substrate-binding protein